MKIKEFIEITETKDTIKIRGQFAVPIKESPKRSKLKIKALENAKARDTIEIEW